MGDQEPRQPFEAPALVELGTVAEATLGEGLIGEDIGGLIGS